MGRTSTVIHLEIARWLSKNPGLAGVWITNSFPIGIFFAGTVPGVPAQLPMSFIRIVFIGWNRDTRCDRGGGGIMADQEPKAELDGFNMADFAINPAAQPLIIKKVIIQVPTKKPNKQKFFRVMAGPEWEISVYVLELKEEAEYYLVRPEILPYLMTEVKYVRLHLAYYLDGSPFLIPVPLPDTENPAKWNSWHRSLDEVVKRAREEWVRAIPDKSINGYQLMVAPGTFECPPLPEDMTLQDYLRIAFKDRIIDSQDHPVVKALLGLR